MSLELDIKKMAPDRAMQVLRVASVIAIVALVLMVWSLFDPTPAPVLIALSLGQALGTVSFVAYITIVAWDLRRRRRAPVLGSSASLPPPSGSLLGGPTSAAQRSDGKRP